MPLISGLPTSAINNDDFPLPPAAAAPGLMSDLSEDHPSPARRFPFMPLRPRPTDSGGGGCVGGRASRKWWPSARVLMMKGVQVFLLDLGEQIMSLMWKKSDPDSDKEYKIVLGVNYEELFY